MTNINTYTIADEAKSIVDEGIEQHAKHSPTEDIEDFMDTWIKETVDGHQWVIYYHYAHQVAAVAEYGEQYLDEIGMTPKTYNEFATLIAYGELVTMADNYWYDIKDQIEDEIAKTS